MKISSASRNTSAPNPSHFGSKIQPPSAGNSLTRLASIGKIGGFTRSCTPQSKSTFEANDGECAPLSFQWRQQRLAPWRKVLIDGVQHETYSEVFAHNRHDLDRMLTPEMGHHLFPKLTADFVFAKQRPPETDQCRVLVG